MTTTTLTGPWLRAPNLSADSAGSIHDEREARKVGFESALVGGSVLLAFMTPTLTGLFGRAWYERGFLKQSFVSPIYESTEFRTYAEEMAVEPGDERLLAFGLEKRDGERATMGYAGIRRETAPAIPPWERRGEPPLAAGPGDDPLPGAPIGRASAPVALMATPELGANRARRAASGEISPWYETRSPWGASIVPTFMFILTQAMRARGAERRAEADGAIQAGMNGTFQLLLTGPMFCGREYQMTSTLVEKGVSGRTAFRTNQFGIDREGRTVALARQKVRWFQRSPAG